MTAGRRGAGGSSPPHPAQPPLQTELTQGQHPAAHSGGPPGSRVCLSARQGPPLLGEGWHPAPSPAPTLAAAREPQPLLPVPLSSPASPARPVPEIPGAYPSFFAPPSLPCTLPASLHGLAPGPAPSGGHWPLRGTLSRGPSHGSEGWQRAPSPEPCHRGGACDATRSHTLLVTPPWGRALGPPPPAAPPGSCYLDLAQAPPPQSALSFPLPGQASPAHICWAPPLAPLQPTPAPAPPPSSQPPNPPPP